MQEQQVEFYIYPHRNPSGEVWITSGYVLGDWVVHRCHPEERSSVARFPWHITHLPTGVRCFASKNKITALRAAKRLLAIDQPAIKIEYHGSNRVPTVAPISLEWVQVCAEALDGLDILGVAGYRLLRPDEMVRHVTETHNIVVYDQD